MQCTKCLHFHSPQADVGTCDDATIALMRFAPFGQTLLHLAAAGDADVAAVKQLIAIDGVDLNAMDAAGRTPLAVAGKVGTVPPHPMKWSKS
jgi:hypothetical protein